MEALPAKVLDALRKGNKIEAIKLLRQVRSLGLAEAKNFVERQLQHDPKMMRDPDEARTLPPAHAAAPPTHAASPHPQYIPRPGLSPGEVPRGGGGAAAAFAILMAVVVSVAAYFLLN